MQDHGGCAEDSPVIKGGRVDGRMGGRTDRQRLSSRNVFSPRSTAEEHGSSTSPTCRAKQGIKGQTVTWYVQRERERARSRGKERERDREWARTEKVESE